MKTFPLENYFNTEHSTQSEAAPSVEPVMEAPAPNIATTVRIMCGNAMEQLKLIEGSSIDCCMTSPPYWGLRDYKTEPIVWDSNSQCEHEWGDVVKCPTKNGTQGSTETDKWPAMQRTQNSPNGLSFCQKCGAWRGQLGLEPTPQLYIKHLCDIFDEVKRVLKPTGTCWVNLGDSYSGSCSGNIEDNKAAQHGTGATALGCNRPTKKIEGIKEKSLVQIPSRFAIEMTDRGWILRNEIVWHKPNCMPSSASDRFTVDFEKVFFFVKNKKYYFEQQFEPLSLNSDVVYRQKLRSDAKYEQKDPYKQNFPKTFNSEGRNKRCVWSITTKPYSGAHFAVFPKELPEVCIKAGTSEKGCCPKCGMPWQQILERQNESNWEFRKTKGAVGGSMVGGNKQQIGTGWSHDLPTKNNITIGWEPTCKCNMLETIPCVVLDPFAGSGTVGQIAKELGRSSVLIEVNPEYIGLIKERVGG